MSLAEELQNEQAQVNIIYDALDSQQSHYRRQFTEVVGDKAGGTPQSVSERDAMAAYYTDQIARLEKVEHNLVFGRLAPLNSLPIYIGRVGLHNQQNEQLLIDWRAPAATAFYQATSLNPMGVVTRRHISLHNREVVGLEDELLDEKNQDSDSDLVLQGEGALMAALGAGRSGYMSDIVATIQAEQDKIIRSNCNQMLIVQGGPGTGKTAVALHRAAFLLYEHAARLEKSGVLVVGPSPTFLRYIQQVLPALGETGVVSTTIGSLFPGIDTNLEDSPSLAHLKGDLRWVEIAKNLVRSLQRIPTTTKRVKVGGIVVELTPQIVSEGIRRARLTGKPHNVARQTYANYVVEALSKQYSKAEKKQREAIMEAANLFGNGDHEDSNDSGLEQLSWAADDIRANIDLRREINLCWMPYSAPDLLAKFYAYPSLRSQVAPMLTEEERVLLHRDKHSPITVSDIPIIDELAELLGPIEAVTQANRSQARKILEEKTMAHAQEAIASQNLGDGMVNAQLLRDRVWQRISTSELAERAHSDRTWTYGHVVVDEAQELSHLAWRMLMRRCPSRSFTVVGDLSQRRFFPETTWNSLLGEAAKCIQEQAVLSVCYRTPQSIMALAERVVAAAGYPVEYPVKSVRDLPDCIRNLEVTQVTSDIIQNLINEQLEELDDALGVGSGRIAVIVPTDDLQELAKDLHQQNDPIAQRVCVITAAESKGLEFDHVILVNPENIKQQSISDLFVALTRPTRVLTTLTDTDYPDGWNN